MSKFNSNILEKKRLEKGLSYTDIAKSLSLHKATVSRALNGITTKPKTIKSIADFLEVKMESIMI